SPGARHLVVTPGEHAVHSPGMSGVVPGGTVSQVSPAGRGKTQPWMGSHVSVVHPSWSSQGGFIVKTQALAAQGSRVLSLHVPSGAASELQVSVVHTLLSVQTGQKKIWPVPKLPAVSPLLHVVPGP